MRAVDTNVLVRLVTRDDEKQLAVAQEFEAKGVWASLLVLAETTWVLTDSYDFTHAEVAAVIEMWLNHRYINLQDPDVVEAALEEYRRRPSLGFSDCLVLEIAKKAGHVPLGTFDKALARLDGTERL